MNCEELIGKSIEKDALYEELLQLKRKLDHAFQLYSTIKDRYDAKKSAYCKLDRALAMHDGRLKVAPARNPKPLPKEKPDKSPARAASDALTRMTADERAALLLEIEGSL